MLNNTLTAFSELRRENERFYSQKGNTDNQTFTKVTKIFANHFLPLSPNDAPVKPKREAD